MDGRRLKKLRHFPGEITLHAGVSGSATPDFLLLGYNGNPLLDAAESTDDAHGYFLAAAEAESWLFFPPTARALGVSNLIWNGSQDDRR